MCYQKMTCIVYRSESEVIHIHSEFSVLEGTINLTHVCIFIQTDLTICQAFLCKHFWLRGIANGGDLETHM
jgi:hypothetical protein